MNVWPAWHRRNSSVGRGRRRDPLPNGGGSQVASTPCQILNDNALHEVLQEHMNVLAAAEACSAASAARQTVMVSQLQSALQPPPKRGRPAALPVQPPPKRGRPAALPVPAPAVAAADTLNKCCCGVIFQTTASLKRHHDGGAGARGKRPREPAHPCTAGCKFSSRARK